ncbi:DUF421 domain-containing protein [Pinibacter aurantiacus]|uniref:DUF421 domain-containing protein n=1 Tax=Pinibacter aurantiacus TaxID=2851599 RepID=A0A9E2W8L2_9BACT|nr:YetF domain-containing protein [Pinibacter aurantiacus]MBV4358696.1 DUF421 domain-containing protein [Pinibacter aurantiacus]
MHILLELFGEGKDLSSLQMSMRSLVVFIIALILIRLAGIRAFGKHSSFDNVVTIMLGAVLSRVVVGASDFLPTVAASATLVIMHRIIGRLTIKPSLFSKWVKGERTILFDNGSFLQGNMKKSQISVDDMQETIRKKLNQESFDNIKKIYAERDGSISIIVQQHKKE